MNEVIHFPEHWAKPSFCDTVTGRYILGVLKICHDQGGMGMVIGPPGVGKTEAAAYYHRANPYSTWHITMSPAAKTVAACLVRLYNIMSGYSVGSGRGMSPVTIRAEVIERIIQKRSERRSFGEQRDPLLIIIDETQHLSDDAVDEIRSIYDETGVGLVFLGDPVLGARWTAKPGPKRDTWAQIKSRMIVDKILGPSQFADVEALCDYYGIKGETSIKRLHKAAINSGGLRQVVRIAEAALKVAGPSNPIQLQHIEAVADVRGLKLPELGG